MQKGNGIVGFIVIIAIIWGVYSLFQDNNEPTSIMRENANYEEYEETKDCITLAPSNPYDEGSGHYAGFGWGENGNSCEGNSNSFVEGCEDYETQESAYQACLGN